MSDPRNLPVSKGEPSSFFIQKVKQVSQGLAQGRLAKCFNRAAKDMDALRPGENQLDTR